MALFLFMEKRQTDFTFFKPLLSCSGLRSPELQEEEKSLSLPYGSLEIKQYYFDGIRINHRKIDYNGHYFFTNENDLEVVNLQFNLKGKYKIQHQGNEYIVKGRQHNIVYSKGTNNTFINEDLHAETFEVQIEPDRFQEIVKDSNDALKRFVENMQDGKPVVLSFNSPFITPELQSIINDMVHCRFQGSLKKMFLLSKSIELLVVQAEAHEKAGNNVYCKRNEDKEKLLYAREYLIKNHESPPTLSELSKEVGMNEYKLKRGFKETFQTTVFGYLAEYRLEMARKALMDNQKSLSQIAYELGYSSPQHFSVAFKKKFGVSPGRTKI